MKFLDPTNSGPPQSLAARNAPSPATNLSRTLSPAENLALDEALLRADVGPIPNETLRIWEESHTAVIVGRSSRLVEEVNLARCQAREVPVLRRCSGGCAIVVGPGCLMYSVVLDLRHRPQLRIIDQAHEYVLSRTMQALHACGIDNVRKAGLSDLVIESDTNLKKFSGNSLRITRDALLYHGTVLYDFRLSTVAELLPPPPREPAYRDQRGHVSFVTNLTLEPNRFVSSLRSVWLAREALETWPKSDVAELVSKKYATSGWNHRH